MCRPHLAANRAGALTSAAICAALVFDPIPAACAASAESSSAATDSGRVESTQTLPAAPLGGPLTSARITGSAFRPRQDDVDYSVNSSGGCVYITGGDSSTVWNHKLTLPQGARINTVRMYYNDTSSSDSTGWLTIYDLYGAIVQEWSVSSVGSAGNSFNDTVAIDHSVDYNAEAYLLNWRPSTSGAGMQLCGFRVFYVDPFIFRDGFELGA